MNQILDLNLNNTESLIFDSNALLKEVLFCEEIYVYFMNTERHLLSFDCLQFNLLHLKELLNSSLNNNLRLHGSITKDIGYLWNEKFNEKSKITFAYDVIEGNRHWIGKQYILWETPGNIKPNLTTWLYNDNDGDIILEITPNYFWHHFEPEQDEEFVSYESFIKDYKPCLIRVIPHLVANKWLEQINHLLRIINENEKQTSRN